MLSAARPAHPAHGLVWGPLTSLSLSSIRQSPNPAGPSVQRGGPRGDGHLCSLGTEAITALCSGCSCELGWCPHPLGRPVPSPGEGLY